MPQNTAQTNQPSGKKIPQTPPSSPSLEQFVDQLIKEKNFPKNLLPEVLTQIKADLMDMLQRTLNAKILARLKEADQKEFMKMIDEGRKAAETQKFVKEKIPDLEIYLAGVLSEFRKTYLGIV